MECRCCEKHAALVQVEAVSKSSSALLFPEAQTQRDPEPLNPKVLLLAVLFVVS